MSLIARMMMNSHQWLLTPWGAAKHVITNTGRHRPVMRASPGRPGPSMSQVTAYDDADLFDHLDAAALSPRQQEDPGRGSTTGWSGTRIFARHPRDRRRRRAAVVLVGVQAPRRCSRSRASCAAAARPTRPIGVRLFLRGSRGATGRRPGERPHGGRHRGGRPHPGRAARRRHAHPAPRPDRPGHRVPAARSGATRWWTRPSATATSSWSASSPRPPRPDRRRDDRRRGDREGVPLPRRSRCSWSRATRRSRSSTATRPWSSASWCRSCCSL